MSVNQDAATMHCLALRMSYLLTFRLTRMRSALLMQVCIRLVDQTLRDECRTAEVRIILDMDEDIRHDKV